MTVKVFRLITGEDLISGIKERIEDNKEHYILDNPAVIVVQETKEGMQVGLVPYLPLINGDIYLNKSLIVGEGNPDTQMENEYSRRFGSGIVLAGANALNQLG